MLSSVGGGALSGVIAGALERARSKGERGAAPDLDALVAGEIERVLAAQDANASALRAEIGVLLQKIDVGGAVLQAAMDQSDERVRSDVFAAMAALSSSFSETRFLIGDVLAAAAQIQKGVDENGARIRAVIEQNDRQSTDIRLVREEVAVIARRSQGALGARPDGDVQPRWAGGCPYRGLLPFEQADAEVFYGRERLTAELAGRLAAQMPQGGLLVVTGASGAGKSSLLRAGLLPVLARGQQVEGSQRWPQITMTPTKDPLAELATQLEALGRGNARAIRDELRLRPREAHMAVWSAVLAEAGRREPGRPAPGGGAARLVLIIDQFEQVFTLNADQGADPGRQAFISALGAAATNAVGSRQEPPALVVIAVRGDFWDRCAAYPELADALKKGPFVVGPMTGSELRLAITGPAEAAGLQIDPGLTDTILADLHAAGSEETAVLPLLSQAMSLTWEKRDGNRLTSHGYGLTGGISSAVQTSADGVYDALPPGQQALTRELLRGMTVTGREGQLSRRPVSRADLYAGRHEADRPAIDAVLEAFAQTRLIVVNDDQAQIAHDILLRAWPRLRAWLEEDQASWILHGQLADDAAAWHGHNDDSSFLYRGTQLAAVQQATSTWAANPARYPALTSTQRDFLHASQNAVTRSARRRRSAVAILAVLALVASIASVFAFQQRTSALRARDQAVYNAVVAEALQASATDTSLAAQLNLAAYRMKPTKTLTSRLLSTENTALSIPLTSSTSSGVNAVAFSPDGRILAAGNDDGTVRLWNVTSPANPQPLGQPLASSDSVLGGVNAVAFSPDGRILATGNGDGTVRLWNVTSPAHPQPLGQPLTRGTVSAFSVAFSPDGRILAAGNNDGTVRLWNVTNPANPQPLGQPLTSSKKAVFSVAFSPDGRILAAGNNDGTVRLWNVTSPVHPQPLGQPLTGVGPILSVAFSPNGRILASANSDGTVRLWNVTSPAHPQPLGQPLTSSTVEVSSVAFSPDGRILAAGNGDGTVRLWNLASPAHPQPLGQPLTGSTGTVWSVAFSPDGRTLAAGAEDGTVRLWSLPQTILAANASPVHSVEFDPVGRILAVGSGDGTVRLWNVASPTHPQPLGQPLTGSTGSAVDSVAFSPDGRILAVGSRDGTVRLWNVASPTHPQPLGQPLTDSTGSAVDSVAFSPDDRTLAADNGDGTVRLWNVASPANPQPLGQPFLLDSGIGSGSMAFSPDGRTLATGTVDGTVQLWNVTSTTNPQPFVLPLYSSAASAVDSLAFSPRASILANGNHDGTVQLWNLASPAHPRPLGQPLTSSTGGAVNSVAFSPDGRILAAGSDDGTVQLWNVASPAHPQSLGQPLTGSTSTVWSVAFSADGLIIATGDDDGTSLLWDLDVNYAIERICTAARNNLTPSQWHNYIPLPYQPPCGTP